MTSPIFSKPIPTCLFIGILHLRSCEPIIVKPKKNYPIPLKNKVMLFSYVSPSEIVPKEYTVNKKYYLVGLKFLLQKIRKERYNYGFYTRLTSHKASIVFEFKTKNATNDIDQATYPLDLSFLSPKQKLPLHETCSQPL